MPSARGANVEEVGGGQPIIGLLLPLASFDSSSPCLGTQLGGWAMEMEGFSQSRDLEGLSAALAQVGRKPLSASGLETKGRHK